MLATRVRSLPLSLAAAPGYFASAASASASTSPATVNSNAIDGASSTRTLATLARDQRLQRLRAQQQAALHSSAPREALRIRRAEAADYPSIAALISANRGLDLTPRERSEQGFVAGAWGPDRLASLSASGPGFWVAEITGGTVASPAPSPYSSSASASSSASGPALFDPSHPPEWRLAGAALSIAPGALASGPAASMASVAEKHFGKQGYYLWGPVVVDSEFRGHGVLRKLSDAVFEGTRDTYSTAVAFIEDVNHVSRVVHERLGWKAVDGFSVGDSKYNVFWHATA